MTAGDSPRRRPIQVGAKCLGVSAALACLAWAGCSEAPDASAGTTIDTVGGVVHARTSAASPPGTRWRLDSLFSIGTALGGGPEAFGRIRSVTSGPQGHIYVADPVSNQIRVFAADGAYRRAIGREGEGPGEFGALYSLAWLGDTLAALDPRNARISLLTRRGEPAGLFRHQALSGGPRLIRLYQTGPREFATLAVVPTDRSIARKIVRFGAAGPSDTVPYPDDPFVADDPTAGGTSIVCETPDRGLSFFDVPFAPRHFAVPAPGGLTAVVGTADYRAFFVDATGDTVRVVERAYEPIPTDEEEWRRALEPYRRFRDENPAARCRPPDPERPARHPSLHLVFFDRIGRMWVEVETREGRRWDVFDPRGRLLGSLTAPPRGESLVPWADAGRFYNVRTDELGVHRLTVYRIVRP